MKNLISTKIIATIGPATDTKEKIKALTKAGVTMFRLNSSHENEAVHLNRLNIIREIEKCGYKPYIIKDLGKYNLEKVNSEFKLFLINMGLQIK